MMTNQDGFTMKERAKMLMDKFEGKKYSMIYCDMIISDEFYGTERQIYYRKMKELIHQMQETK